MSMISRKSCAINKISGPKTIYFVVFFIRMGTNMYLRILPVMQSNMLIILYKVKFDVVVVPVFKYFNV